MVRRLGIRNCDDRLAAIASKPWSVAWSVGPSGGDRSFVGAGVGDTRRPGDGDGLRLFGPGAIAVSVAMFGPPPIALSMSIPGNQQGLS